GHPRPSERFVIVIDQVRSAFFRRGGERGDANEPKSTSFLAPDPQPLQRNIDPLHVRLERAHEQDRWGPRVARRRREERLSVEGLANVDRGPEPKLIQPSRERRRDRKLAGRRAIGFVDRFSLSGIETKRAFVSLAEVEDRTSRLGERGKNGRPKSRDANIAASKFLGVAEGTQLEPCLRDSQPLHARQR